MPSHRQDKRKSPRRPLRRAAWLAIGSDATPRPCVRWDISDNGARLTVARLQELPDRFTLVLSKQAPQHHCEVVWRTQRFVGVRFLRWAIGDAWRAADS